VTENPLGSSVWTEVFTHSQLALAKPRVCAGEIWATCRERLVILSQSLGLTCQPEARPLEHGVGLEMRKEPPPLRRADWLPMAGGLGTRLAYTRARSAGVALDPLLRKAGLTRKLVEDAGSPIKVRDQIRFLDVVADAVDDELLGFHLAQVPDLREIGLLYYVLASSDTLIDALHRAARYSIIANEGISLKCIDGKAIGTSFHYIGVGRHLDRHQIEFWMTALVRICRQLTGLRLLPSRVRLMHHRAWNAELSQFLGNNVEFGAADDDLTFSNNVRQSPVVSADPYLNGVLRSYCEEAISRRARTRASFGSKVENAVIPLLPHGKAQVGEIARQLGVSRRTLARRLSGEGLSFSALLDSLRFDLANRHLADSELAISQIAWLLGYRDVGAFSHAFKRWTGKSPSKARG
jgi:AraC-like DNA-binding protein